MITTRQTLQRSALLAIGVLALTGSPALALDYVFRDLGTINGPLAGQNVWARGVNDAGQVVGHGDVATYVWTNGTPTQLNSLPGGVGTVGININEAGHVAGAIDLGPAVDAFIPVRWDGSTPIPVQVLGGGTQAFSTLPWNINNHDQMVGFGWSDGTQRYRPLSWDSNGNVTDLGTLGGAEGFAYGINDAGQVVGQSFTTNDDANHATLWDHGAIVDLGTLGGASEAFNINEAGIIVGYSELADGVTTRAVFWNGATPTELPSLGGVGTYSDATDINNLGQMIGYSGLDSNTWHAVVWEHGNVIDLNQFLPADLKAAGWVLAFPQAINDHGVIVGWAQNDPTGAIAAFELTPVPVPAAVYLFGTGLIGLAGLARRRMKGTA